MKKLHNNLNIKIKILSIAIFSILILIPILLLAHPENPTLGAYCAKLLIFQVDIEKKINDIEASYTSKESTIINEISKIRTEQDANIKKNRDEVHKTIQKTFVRLEPAIAEGNSELVKKKFENAQSEYDKLIDEAVMTYRKGIDNLIQARKNSLMSSKNQFKTSYKEILIKSKKDACESKTETRDIFVEMTTELKKVHENFKATILSLDSIESDLNKLTETRNDMVKNAQEKLRNDIEQIVASF